MRSNQSYVRVAGTATAFAAGAAPKTVNGASIATRQVEVGSLSVLATAALTTNTTTATAKWQVSDDASTWYDVSPENNAANVTLATGTGTGATTSKVLAAPQGVYSWNFARVQVVTGVSTADGSADAATVSYRYLKDRW